MVTEVKIGIRGVQRQNTVTWEREQVLKERHLGIRNVWENWGRIRSRGCAVLAIPRSNRSLHQPDSSATKGQGFSPIIGGLARQPLTLEDEIECAVSKTFQDSLELLKCLVLEA